MEQRHQKKEGINSEVIKGTREDLLYPAANCRRQLGRNDVFKCLHASVPVGGHEYDVVESQPAFFQSVVSCGWFGWWANSTQRRQRGIRHPVLIVVV